MKKDTSFKYYAFISYNSKDIAWGKKLQRKLEHYRMPATLCSERGWDRTPIKPVFFAPTDIQPGVLSEELKERLRVSRHLIVICSPNSAKSKWVGEEIAFFHSLGREKHILFFIVDGVPNSGREEDECYNSIINSLGIPEILGANINEKIYRWNWLNKERAYAQLISKLLEVEFDTIWNRHRRLLIQKIIGWIASIIIVFSAMGAVWASNQPVNVEISLNEGSLHNQNLPPLKDAEVTLSLDNEVKIDTVDRLCDNAVFANIPHRYLGRRVRLSVKCEGYYPVDTNLVLQNNISANIFRDTMKFGKILFRLWDVENEQALSDVEVELEGRKVRTDDTGSVDLYIPLAEQRERYLVKVPYFYVIDTLYMPCGGNDVIVVEKN